MLDFGVKREEAKHLDERNWTCELESTRQRGGESETHPAHRRCCRFLAAAHQGNTESVYDPEGGSRD
jgi:hypothetical protein